MDDACDKSMWAGMEQSFKKGKQSLKIWGKILFPCEWKPKYQGSGERERGKNEVEKKSLGERMGNRLEENKNSFPPNKK